MIRRASDFKNKRVLVTGGAGFIGSHLVEKLVLLGCEVSVVDNLLSGSIRNIERFIDSDEIEFYKMNVEDSSISIAIHMARPEYVFHLAAMPGVSQSVEDPVKTNKVNVSGSLNMLRACADVGGVKRFIFASSSSVYGGSDNIPTNEREIPNPKSPYALQKLTVEKYCKFFSNEKGLDTVSLRYFNVFGPRQTGDSEYSAVISSFCDSLKNNHRPKIYGDGEQFRDFCYVENVVRANLRVMISKKPLGGQVFNVGCGEKTTINDLVKIMGLSAPLYLPDRKGDVRKSLADISKIQKYFKYKPKVSVSDGIVKTIDWYLKNA